MLLPLANFTDEEILQYAYLRGPPGCTELELELAVRLEHALDELAAKPWNLDDKLTELEDRDGTDT